MSGEREFLRDVLLKLSSNFERKNRDGLSESVSRIKAKIDGIFLNIGTERLESILSDELSVDMSNYDNQVIFLESPEREPILPLLSLKYDFSDTQKPELRFRVAVFYLDDNDDTRAIGYRFETPEGEGVHNFYHVQHIRSFGGHSLPCGAWIPDEQPSIPLDAENVASLMLCVIISIYGFSAISDFRTGSWHRFFHGMRVFSPIFQPKYWAAKDSHGNEVFIQSWDHNDKKVKLILRGQKLRDIAPCDRLSYKIPGKKKKKLVFRDGKLTHHD